MKKSYCLVAAIFLLIFPCRIRGESYDVYVDKNYAGEENGSREQPFRSISRALEVSPGGKIFIFPGLYEERVVLKNSAELQGKSRKEVILSGSLAMEGKNSIRDITVEGGHIAIDVAKDANAMVESCIVKKSRSIGINMAIGKGKMTVRKTDLYNNDRKAMYIQDGNEIEIEDSNIFNNGEEGIDIRAGVSGSIRRNKIYGNKEGGVEFIVGSSRITIEKNTIKNNRASGIAAQFYRESDHTGKINVMENRIVGNGNYGFHCGLPSGGEPSSSYWQNSINLSGNVIEANGIDPIDKFCNIFEAMDENENIDNAITDQPSGENEEARLLMIEEENEPIEVKITQEKAAKEEIISEKADNIEAAFKDSDKKMETELEKTRRSRLALLLLGIKKESASFIEGEIGKNKKMTEELESLSWQSELSENKDSLDSLSREIKERMNHYEHIMRECQSKNNLAKRLVLLWAFLP